MTTSNGYQNTMISAKSTAATKLALVTNAFTEGQTLTYASFTECTDPSYARQTPSWTLSTANKTMKWTPSQFTFTNSNTLTGWILVDSSNNLIDCHHFVSPGTSTPISLTVSSSNPLEIGEITTTGVSSPPAVIS